MTSVSVPAARPLALPRVQIGLLIGWLTIAAAVELAVLRTFTRTAIHIPALEPLSGPYTVIADAGRYAYYLAVTLLVIAIPAVAVVLWRSGPAGRLATLAIAEFAVAAAALRIGVAQEQVLGGVIVMSVVTAAAAAGLVEQRLLLLTIPFAAAFTMAATESGLQSELAYRLGLPRAGWLLDAAEVVAVVAAVAAPFALQAGRSRRRTIAAGAAAALVLALLLGSGPTTRILMLWNEGLSGTLPSVVYAVAAGGFAWAAAGSWGEGRRLQTAAVVLLLAGGIGLHSTYQSGLVVIALALLAIPRQTEAPLAARA